jgi:hypothetical protein
MKNYFKNVMFSAIVLWSLGATAQTTKTVTPADTTVKYYTRLANSSNEADKALLEANLYTLLKSKKESDWLMAQRFFYQLKKINVADSIMKACKIKFPLGQVVRNEEVKKVYDETDATKKEAAYKAWVKKFPPEKFGEDRIQYDYARNAVSKAYAQADNVPKTLEYANMIETGPWKGEGWAGPAADLLKNDHFAEAEGFIKKQLPIPINI